MNNSSQVEWQDTLAGETLLLGMAGRILYIYPDQAERAWIQSMLDEDVFQEAPFATENAQVKGGLELIRKWGAGGITDEKFDSLRADYTRLFIGVERVAAAPWESVHLGKDPLIFQERTLAVRAWYKRFGLEVEKLHQEPDDHIGLELLFLSKLAEQGAQALDASDQEKFEEYINAQRDFLQQHLGAWALSWCGLVEKHARTDFYLGMAALLRGALTELAEILGVQLAKDTAQ